MWLVTPAFEGERSCLHVDEDLLQQCDISDVLLEFVNKKNVHVEASQV